MAERKICACVSDAAASPPACPKIKMFKSAFYFCSVWLSIKLFGDSTYSVAKGSGGVF